MIALLAQAVADDGDHSHQHVPIPPGVFGRSRRAREECGQRDGKPDRTRDSLSNLRERLVPTHG